MASSKPTRLTIIGNGKTSEFVLCRCECGTVREFRKRHVLSHKTRSCGCLLREKIATGCLSRKTHGRTRTPEYNAWNHIISRCTNPKDPRYKNYGGRGIKMCDRWRSSFEHFLADVGDRPTSKHSIDRWPDNDGNYEPGNVRWATRQQQSRNRTDNRLVTFDGRTQTMADWAEEIGMTQWALSQRLNRLGWSLERALTTPLNKKITGRPKKR